MADRVVVVGASLAGLRAVETLRTGGHEGPLTLIGAESRLPYDRPPLSKELLAGTWTLDQLELRAPDSYESLDVDLRLGTTATGLDVGERSITLSDGERVPFDVAIIATGVVPRTLPGTPALEGIHTLRTVEDSLAIRAGFERGAHVVVVGAGFIGSEVAATARRRGLDVTVVEALPVPLARGLGQEMGAVCAALHRDEGTDLRLGVGVDGFDGDRRVEAVRLTSGERLPADLVVVGVGVAPTVGWLEGSALEVRDGVVCDATCAAVGGGGAIYAAGDIARWFNPLFGVEMRVEHWTNAAEQGHAAAGNVLASLRGEPPAEFAPVPFFWSDQYDTKIQFVGHTGPSDEVRVVHGSTAERKFVAIYGREGRLTAALAFSMPRVLMGYRRLLAKGATWEDALALARANS